MGMGDLNGLGELLLGLLGVIFFALLVVILVAIGSYAV
jgi:hypothetical protein